MVYHGMDRSLMRAKQSSIALKISEKYNITLEQVMSDLTRVEKKIYDREHYNSGYAIQHKDKTYYWSALSNLANSYKTIK